MGLSNVVPVFLDNRSGWDKRQTETINITARTARNYFLSKATQKQLPKPEIERIVVSKWNRVLNLRDYAFSDTFSISFILNTSGLEKDVTSPLFSISKTVKSFSFEGSYSDEVVTQSLSSLGKLSIETLDGEPTFCFTPNTDNFPEDENHNRLNYSVYIGGYYDG